MKKKNKRVVRYKSHINLNAGIVIFGLISIYLLINIVIYFTTERTAFYEVISKQAFNVHKITTATVTHILIPNEVIKDLFEDVIRCRNRLAHNAYVNISVRNDLPELCNRKELDCNNIFMQFFVLLYIDNVFNETYKVYWEEFANL